MRKLLTIFFLLITPVTFSQGFLARIDIRHVEDIDDTTWRIVGDIVDVTGGYDGLDVDTGFIIFQRGVDTSGITIYDRIKIDSIENATTVQLEALVRAQYTIKNNSSRPMSGSFPIMEKLDTTSLLYKPSWYRYAFEGDYETGVDNENLKRINQRLNNVEKYDNHYEINVSSDSENNWNLPFELRSSSTILYNGDPLRSTQWSASPSTILTVTVDVRKYDHIVLIN